MSIFASVRRRPRMNVPPIDNSPESTRTETNLLGIGASSTLTDFVVRLLTSCWGSCTQLSSGIPTNYLIPGWSMRSTRARDHSDGNFTRNNGTVLSDEEHIIIHEDFYSDHGEYNRNEINDEISEPRRHGGSWNKLCKPSPSPSPPNVRGRRASLPFRCSSDLGETFVEEPFEGTLRNNTRNASRLISPQKRISAHTSSGTEVNRWSPLSMNSSPARSSEPQMGKILVSAQYFADRSELEMSIREAYDLPRIDIGQHMLQIRLCLLPEKKQKHSVTITNGNNSFKQTFSFQPLDQEQLAQQSIRFRVYRIPRQKGIKPDILLGETILRCCLIDARTKAATHHLLEFSFKFNAKHKSSVPKQLSAETSDYRRKSVVDTNTGYYSTNPAGRTPEILVSLCYNDMTGKLVITLEKGSCFGFEHKNPDTQVKVTVLSPYGEEIGKSKTNIHKASNDPDIKETFLFQVPNAELQYVSVLIQVYCFVGIWRKKILLGWISLGQSSNLELQNEHWKEMLSGSGITVSKWHVLILP